MRTLAFLSAALLAAALAPASARAQASAVDHDPIVERLNAARVRTADEGYAAAGRIMDGNVVRGSLPQGGSVVLEVSLRAGVEYVVAGACDEHCDDLDLRIQGPEGGAPLDEDVEPDAAPILTFTATESGPHALSVILSSCREPRCRFGFRIFGR